MMLRSVFAHEEDPEYWRKATKPFDNKVPRFDTKADAVEFTKQHCTNLSNPDEQGLQHCISTLTSWDQVAKHLIPKIKSYEKEWAPVQLDSKQTEQNCFLKGLKEEGQKSEKDDTSRNPSYAYLLSRLNLSIHQQMSSQSTINTLHYLFTHMRCGIFVMIRNNQLAIFCPFVNKEYTNTWGEYPMIDAPDGSIPQYYDKKRHSYREENVIPDKSKWWANGNIMCNEHDRSMDGNTQWWGDHFLFQLKDMVAETCNQRHVPDCEFFINKRDYPQLKFNTSINGGQGMPVEPYGFIFDKDDRDPAQDVPLSRHSYASYTPILSFYSSDRFADVPMPPSEDWESATGMVFPSSFFHSRYADSYTG